MRLQETTTGGFPFPPLCRQHRQSGVGSSSSMIEGGVLGRITRNVHEDTSNRAGTSCTNGTVGNNCVITGSMTETQTGPNHLVNSSFQLSESVQGRDLWISRRRLVPELKVTRGDFLVIWVLQRHRGDLKPTYRSLGWGGVTRKFQHHSKLTSSKMAS